MAEPNELAEAERRVRSFAEYAEETGRRILGEALNVVLAEYDRRGTRVEQLTAALTELVGAADRVSRLEGDPEVDWTGLLRTRVAESRAALAAAVEEAQPDG